MHINSWHSFLQIKYVGGGKLLCKACVNFVRCLQCGVLVFGCMILVSFCWLLLCGPLAIRMRRMGPYGTMVSCLFAFIFPAHLSNQFCFSILLTQIRAPPSIVGLTRYSCTSKRNYLTMMGNFVAGSLCSRWTGVKPVKVLCT